MAGSVITFYSYKGGVGRSFALPNVGTLLARWGFKVLCIDFDLEAPGLAQFFGSVPQTPEAAEWLLNAPGLVEMVEAFKGDHWIPLDWRAYVRRLDAPGLGGIALMKAGRTDTTYHRRLQRLSWQSLYRAGLGSQLERMFDELREEFDYVLIDARTGVTDFSGIITAQLPDVLAFLFTANEQSLEGSMHVARRAAEARNGLALDRSRLLLLPIPARFETQVEHRISLLWRDRFVAELAEFYDGWAGANDPIPKLVQATTIPYVPYWSFGERLSVVEDESSDTLGINFTLETLAALLAHRLGQTGLLLDSRDDFVAAAKRLARNRVSARRSVFLSYDHANTFAAEGLREALEQRGTPVFMDRHDLPSGAQFEAELDAAIEGADHMLVLVGDRTRERRGQIAEIRKFLRQAASDERPRFVVPVLLEGTPSSAIPDVLRQYRTIDLGIDFDGAARKVSELLQPRSAERPGRVKRKCYLSFSYVHDLWRVQQIRNMGSVETQPILDDGSWETVRRGGEAAIAELIAENMRSSECLIVLVGAETTRRKWATYEIERAWREGLGLLAIHVHKLRDRDGRQTRRGADPFEGLLVDGSPILARVYDPPFDDSGAVYEHIRMNINAWISEAVDARQ